MRTQYFAFAAASIISLWVISENWGGDVLKFSSILGSDLIFPDTRSLKPIGELPRLKHDFMALMTLVITDVKRAFALLSRVFGKHRKMSPPKCVPAIPLKTSIHDFKFQKQAEDQLARITKVNFNEFPPIFNPWSIIPASVSAYVTSNTGKVTHAVSEQWQRFVKFLAQKKNILKEATPTTPQLIQADTIWRQLSEATGLPNIL